MAVALLMPGTRGAARVLLLGALFGMAGVHARPESDDEGARNIWEENTIWIEDSPNRTLVLRFGIFGKLTEGSPGNLDRLAAVAAWRPQGEGRPAPLRLTKASDHFLINEVDARSPVQAEELTVMVRHGGERGYLGRKPILYARWQPAGAEATVPRLTLDIVPTEKTGEFRVYFRGRPLPAARVRSLGPVGFVPHESAADSEGFVRVGPSGAGLYQLTCSHTEDLPVFVAGFAYKGTRHRTTVTWRQG